MAKPKYDATATVEFVEQPVRYTRFRYECEIKQGHKSQSLLGRFSSNGYPKVRVKFRNSITPQPYSLLVSLVTQDKHHYPHPFEIQGTTSNNYKFSKGVCVIECQGTEEHVDLQGMGIIRLRSNEYAKTLKERVQEARIDPFKTGCSISKKYEKVVMLAVQCFLRDPKTKTAVSELKPIVSEAILDKKDEGELEINHLSPLVIRTANEELTLVTRSKCKAHSNLLRARFCHQDGTQLDDVSVENRYHDVVFIFKVPRLRQLQANQPYDVQVMLCRTDTDDTSISRLIRIYYREDAVEAKRKKPIPNPERNVSAALPREANISGGAAPNYPAVHAAAAFGRPRVPVRPAQSSSSFVSPGPPYLQDSSNTHSSHTHFATGSVPSPSPSAAPLIRHASPLHAPPVRQLNAALFENVSYSPLAAITEHPTAAAVVGSNVFMGNQSALTDPLLTGTNQQYDVISRALLPHAASSASAAANVNSALMNPAVSDQSISYKSQPETAPTTAGGIVPPSNVPGSEVMFTPSPDFDINAFNEVVVSGLSDEVNMDDLLTVINDQLRQENAGGNPNP